MGMPNNSDIFFSDKDLELNFLARPMLDLPDGSRSSLVAHSEDHGHDHPHQEQAPEEERDQENCGIDIVTSYLEIKIPSLGEFKNDEEKEEEEDGFRTPTSLDQRIPLILTCPPAPRKPKSLPSTKRKASHHRKIILDLSSEIQSLFPPALIEDLGGKKIKKAREV